MLKSTFLFISFLMMSSWVMAQLEFSSTEILFDSIYCGQEVRKAVTFKNTSGDTIQIINATTSCGCFMVQWPKKPILPGTIDSLELFFNSNGKEGYQNKAATIYLSDKRMQRLYLKGFVKPPLIEFSSKYDFIIFQKDKPEYTFEIENTGDSIIYIDKAEIYNNIPSEEISFQISKTGLKKNESSIITVRLGEDFINLLEENFEEIEISVSIKDCCGLTESYKIFLITSD